MSTLLTTCPFQWQKLCKQYNYRGVENAGMGYFGTTYNNVCLWHERKNVKDHVLEGAIT